MPPLMGNGEGHTLLILTDAESRLIRETLCHALPSTHLAVEAYYSGLFRGTVKLAEEFKAEQAARKAKKK